MSQIKETPSKVESKDERYLIISPRIDYNMNDQRNGLKLTKETLLQFLRGEQKDDSTLIYFSTTLITEAHAIDHLISRKRITYLDTADSNEFWFLKLNITNEKYQDILNAYRAGEDDKLSGTFQPLSILYELGIFNYLVAATNLTGESFTKAELEEQEKQQQKFK